MDAGYDRDVGIDIRDLMYKRRKGIISATLERVLHPSLKTRGTWLTSAVS